MAEHSKLISSCTSSAVLLLILYGLFRRHRPSTHVPTMLACCVIDVANVVYIEVMRSAVATTISTLGTRGQWLLQFHILISVLTLVGYGVAIGTGVRLLRTGRGRRFHRANAAVFLLLRVLNYITSFYV